MRSVGFAVTFCPGLVALINLSLGSFELFIAGLVSLCCDGIFASCPCCVCILAARRSSRFLSQCGVFLLFFVFGVTSVVQSLLEALSSASLTMLWLLSSSSLLFCVSMWPVCWSSSGVSCMRSVVSFLPSVAVGVAPDPMTSS